MVNFILLSAGSQRCVRIKQASHKGLKSDYILCIVAMINIRETDSGPRIAHEVGVASAVQPKMQSISL